MKPTLTLAPWTLDAATAALKSVLSVHECLLDFGQVGWFGMDRPADGRFCAECGVPNEYAVAWPCPTVCAILAANGVDTDGAIAGVASVRPTRADFAAAMDEATRLRLGAVCANRGYLYRGVHVSARDDTTSVHVSRTDRVGDWTDQELTEDLGRALNAYVAVISTTNVDEVCHDCA